MNCAMLNFLNFAIFIGYSVMKISKAFISEMNSFLLFSIGLLPADNVKMTTSKDDSATVKDEIEIQGHTDDKHEGTWCYFKRDI